jgi:type I restriction enzyme, R subunit
MILDGEKLLDLLEPLELCWKECRLKELALMEIPCTLIEKDRPRTQYIRLGSV